MTACIRNIGGGRLAIEFPYSREAVEKMHQIQGREWHPEGRYWTVPADRSTEMEVRRIFSCDQPTVRISGLVSERKTDLRTVDKPSPVLPEKSKSGLLSEQWAGLILPKLAEELRLKGYSPKTCKSYIGHIRRFALFYGGEPDNIIVGDIRRYLLELLSRHNLSHAYVNQAASALKFMAANIFKNNALIPDIPRCKKEYKLPEIMSRSEVTLILSTVTNLKHKAILMLVYSAGLRVGEVVKLQINDIDAKRMLIHIKQGKGRKDRYTILSGIAVETLRLFYGIPLQRTFWKTVQTCAIYRSYLGMRVQRRLRSTPMYVKRIYKGSAAQWTTLWAPQP